MSFTLKSVPLVAVGDNLSQEWLFERGKESKMMMKQYV